MATYAVSFHLKKDRTYNDRYDSLMEEIEKSTLIWVETTSFCLVRSGKTLATFTSSLYMTAFDPSKDKLLVMDVGDVNATARGDIEYPATLRSLIPSVTIR